MWLSSSPVSQPFHQMAASVRLLAEYGLYPRCSPFVKACLPSEYIIVFCAAGMLATLYLCIVTPLAGFIILPIQLYAGLQVCWLACGGHRAKCFTDCAMRTLGVWGYRSSLRDWLWRGTDFRLEPHPRWDSPHDRRCTGCPDEGCPHCQSNGLVCCCGWRMANPCLLYSRQPRHLRRAMERYHRWHHRLNLWRLGRPGDPGGRRLEGVQTECIK